MRRHLLLIAGFLSLIWLLLTDGAISGLPFGVGFVALGCWVCARIQPSPLGSIGLVQLLRFVPFFIWESLRGGIDVTRRVLSPIETQPSACIDYYIQLKRHDAMIFFVNCINLMPGTLTLGWYGSHVQIHLLDGSSSPLPALHALEQRVALLFKLTPISTPAGEPQ